MDQNLLLTVERLSLNPDVQTGWSAHKTFVIKNVPAQTYLAVSAGQAAVLQLFAKGSTVPEVLSRLLGDAACPPLREFYELVVKAAQAGVLCAGPARTPPRKAIRWPELRAPFLFWPAAGAALASLVLLALRGPHLGTPAPLVAGFGIALAALTLGQMLAAALLVGAGGEVYPKKRSASLALLHLRFDLRDGRLLRPVEQLSIALAANLPLTLCLLAASWKFPQAALPIAAVWLLTWRPWGAGLPRRLANLLSRYPDLDTDTGFLFLPNQRPQLHWRPWWRRWDWRVCAIELVWAAGWSLLVARIVIDELGLSFMEVAGDWKYWSMSLPLVISALLITVMVIMVRRWRDGVRHVWRRLRQRWATWIRHWRHEYVFPDTEAALLRIASAHPLLGQLNPYDQTTVVRAWRPVTVKAWTEIAPGESESNHVNMILCGRASASRVSKSGRRVSAFPLAEGDFFGLPHLLPEGDALLQVKSRTPVSAMALPTSVFKEVIVQRLGADLVYDLTHKYAFLRRLSVCAYWHPQAVGRFARLAQVVAYADGDTILHEKEDPRWFYIVYDGIAQVRRSGKLISRLKSGDFFGEISLLQSSGAIADVVAQGRIRCLQIDRKSFLRFMTHNHHVALQLEKISSARLGRPIFPLGQLA